MWNVGVDSGESLLLACRLSSRMVEENGESRTLVLIGNRSGVLLHLVTELGADVGGGGGAPLGMDFKNTGEAGYLLLVDSEGSGMQGLLSIRDEMMSGIVAYSAASTHDSL